MDGDQSAKTFEQGANSALKENEMTSGIHESVKQTVSLKISLTGRLSLIRTKPAQGEKTTGGGASIFDKTGAVGKQFTGTPKSILLPSLSLRRFIEPRRLRQYELTFICVCS